MGMKLRYTGVWFVEIQSIILYTVRYKYTIYVLKAKNNMVAGAIITPFNILKWMTYLHVYHLGKAADFGHRG